MKFNPKRWCTNKEQDPQTIKAYNEMKFLEWSKNVIPLSVLLFLVYLSITINDRFKHDQTITVSKILFLLWLPITSPLKLVIARKLVRNRFRFILFAELISAMGLIILVILSEIFKPKQEVNSNHHVYEQMILIIPYFIMAITQFYFWQFGVIAYSIICIIALIDQHHHNDDFDAVVVFEMIVVTVSMIYYGFIVHKQKFQSFKHQFRLLQNESGWKQVLRSLPQGVLIMKRDKKVRYCNDAFLNIFGYENPDSLSPEFIEDILINEFQPQLERNSQDHNNNSIDVSADITIGAMNFEERQNQFKSQNKLRLTKHFGDLHDLLENKQKEIEKLFQRASIDPTIVDFKGFVTFQGKIWDKNNEEKNIEVSFTLLRFDNELVCIFVFDDITAKLQVNNLKETINYKNRLLASVSHELRTPLNGTINFVEMAISSQGVQNEIKEQYLIPAVRGSKYLLTIINDILDFSQIGEKTLRLVNTRKSLVSTVKEAMNLIEIQAQKKNLKLEVQLPTENWDTKITTDHNRLLQIVANLLSNSLKFTFSGSVMVKIEEISKPSIMRESQFKISIIDTGIGISKEDQKKLFKYFTKLDLGENNLINPQGVGLGLMISNALAQLLSPQQPAIQANMQVLEPSSTSQSSQDDDSVRGGLVIESELGKGSSFSFIIRDQIFDSYILENSNATTIANRPTNEKVLDTIPDLIPNEYSQSFEILDFMPNSGLTSNIKQILTSQSKASLFQVSNKCNCKQVLVVDDDAFNILALENILKDLGMSYQSFFDSTKALEVVIERAQKPKCESCQGFKIIMMDCNMPIKDGYQCARELDKEIFVEYPKARCPIVACTAFVQASEVKKVKDAGMTDYLSKPLSKAAVQEVYQHYELL